MSEAVSSPAADLRSYGRRRGRKFSAHQSELLCRQLPKCRLDISASAPQPLTHLFVFAQAAKEVWLEIGFGGGEHLVWQAERNPEVGFIGCEPYLDGVVKVLAAIEDRALRNIRIHTDDARDVLRWVPNAALDRVFILFPDPWPKKRHWKRRLVSPSLITLLARTICSGGELRIATDIGDYARTALLSLRASSDFEWLVTTPSDWRFRPADWPQTRYEQKALLAGRRCCFLRFRRR